MSQTLYPQLLRNTRPMSPMSIRNLRRQSPPLNNPLLSIELINPIPNRHQNMPFSPRDRDRARDRNLNSGNWAESLGLGVLLLRILCLGLHGLDCVNEWHACGVGWRNA